MRLLREEEAGLRLARGYSGWSRRLPDLVVQPRLAEAAWRLRQISSRYSFYAPRLETGFFSRPRVDLPRILCWGGWGHTPRGPSYMKRDFSIDGPVGPNPAPHGGLGCSHTPTHELEETCSWLGPRPAWFHIIPIIVIIGMVRGCCGESWALRQRSGHGHGAAPARAVFCLPFAASFLFLFLFCI